MCSKDEKKQEQASLSLRLVLFCIQRHCVKRVVKVSADLPLGNMSLSQILKGFRLVDKEISPNVKTWSKANL